MIALGLRAIRPELEDAIKKSENETNYDIVAAGVETGRLSLWIGLVGDEYAGFAISETLYGINGNWLNIAFAHTIPKFYSKIDILASVLKFFEENAKAHGYRGVKLVSCRKGFSRRVRKLGYRSRMVEYVKEV